LDASPNKLGAAKVVRGSQRFFASMGQLIKIH